MRSIKVRPMFMKNPEKQSPMIPLLAPIDYQLFLYLMQCIPEQIPGKFQAFHDDNEIKIKVEMWFRQQAVNSYDCGMQILHHYSINACMHSDVNYVQN